MYVAFFCEACCVFAYVLVGHVFVTRALVLWCTLSV